MRNSMQLARLLANLIRGKSFLVFISLMTSVTLDNKFMWCTRNTKKLIWICLKTTQVSIHLLSCWGKTRRALSFIDSKNSTDVKSVRSMTKKAMICTRASRDLLKSVAAHILTSTEVLQASSKVVPSSSQRHISLSRYSSIIPTTKNQDKSCINKLRVQPTIRLAKTSYPRLNMRKRSLS